MIRTVSDLLSQQNLPQVRRLKCAIIDVLFPSRSFVVLRAGYGRQVVPADSSIDFGSYARPLVGTGNYVWIELNESDGTWHATKYEANATCTPTTLPNAPNVPLTTYKPPQNTAITFEPFRVDTNFFPHVASIGLLAPASKSPAQTIPGVGAKLVYHGLWNTSLSPAKTGIAINGGYGYTSRGGGNLGVYDLSNPMFGKYVGGGKYAAVNNLSGIRALGNYAYIIDYGITSGNFIILDVLDPLNPVIVSTTALPNNLYVMDFDMVTWGGTVSAQYIYFIFASFSPTSTYVYYMTAPTGPLTLVTTITNATAVAAQGGANFAAGNCVAITERTTPMFKLYYNNGANLRGSVSLGSIDPYYTVGINTTQSRTSNQNPESVWYIADLNTSYITVVDASNAASPVVAGTFMGDSTLVPGLPGNAYAIKGLYIYGGYLFVMGSWTDTGPTNAGALTMFDLSNKLSPKQVSHDLAGAWNTNDYPIAASGYGPYLYLVSGFTGAIFTYSFT